MKFYYLVTPNTIMGVFYKKNEKWEQNDDIKFEGNDKEKKLENLLIENPEIFPVDKIADADTWIPHKDRLLEILDEVFVQK